MNRQDHVRLFLFLQAAEQRDYIIHYAQTPLEDEDRAKTLSTISDVLVTSHAGEVSIIIHVTSRTTSSRLHTFICYIALMFKLSSPRVKVL